MKIPRRRARQLIAALVIVVAAATAAVALSRPETATRAADPLVERLRLMLVRQDDGRHVLLSASSARTLPAIRAAGLLSAMGGLSRDLAERVADQLAEAWRPDQRLYGPGPDDPATDVPEADIRAAEPAGEQLDLLMINVAVTELLTRAGAGSPLAASQRPDLRRLLDALGPAANPSVRHWQARAARAGYVDWPGFEPARRCAGLAERAAAGAFQDAVVILPTIAPGISCRDHLAPYVDRMIAAENEVIDQIRRRRSYSLSEISALSDIEELLRNAGAAPQRSSVTRLATDLLRSEEALAGRFGPPTRPDLVMMLGGLAGRWPSMATVSGRMRMQIELRGSLANRVEAGWYTRTLMAHSWRAPGP
jgi:hypothetical protein